jgi:hypothetical protein
LEQQEAEEIKRLAYHLEVLDTNGVVVNENDEIKELKAKMTGLDVAIAGLRLTNRSHVQQEVLRNTAKVTRSKSCNFCEQTVVKNCDLETHLKEVHDVQKKCKCTVCNKDFVLDWRHKKHMKMHSEDVKFCHFYSNNKKCPFEDIGCMFLHEMAEPCVFNPC